MQRAQARIGTTDLAAFRAIFDYQDAVTEMAPAGDFWEVEPEHQDYLERIPNGYTCHFVRPEWKLPCRADAAYTWHSSIFEVFSSAR